LGDAFQKGGRTNPIGPALRQAPVRQTGFEQPGIDFVAAGIHQGHYPTRRLPLSLSWTVSARKHLSGSLRLEEQLIHPDHRDIPGKT